MTPPKTSPDLSVVTVTRDDFRTLRPIVQALRDQTIADRIELVIAAPRGAADPPPDGAGFHSVRVVEVGPVVNRGRAAAAAVLAARAPIVALTENHCFPTPHWGERLLASHIQGWAGVGPAVENANPESRLSLTMHAFGYGQFPRAGVAREVEELALHNSSFQKEVLPTDLETLEDLLGDERRLNRSLRERGHALRFDPAVVKWHINEATWTLLGGMSYYSGRRYGGTRSVRWPIWRRVLYTVLAPALSLPIARNLWIKLPPEIPRDLPLAGLIGICALLQALGEGGSYLSGAPEEFPFVEEEEFFIRERLGGRPLTRPEVAALVALLDSDDGTE